MLYHPGLRFYSPLPLAIALRYVARGRLSNSPTLATLLVLYAVGETERVLQELGQLESLINQQLRVIGYALQATLDNQVRENEGKPLPSHELPVPRWVHDGDDVQLVPLKDETTNGQRIIR